MHVASEQSGGRATIEVWEAVSRPARPVVRELLVNGPRTRTELARRLGLSNGSLTRLTKPLVHSGLLVERGIVHDPMNGHPTRPLDIVAADYHFLGVKLTSDRLYGVITDLRAEVVAECSEPLAGRTPEAVAAQAGDLRARLAGKSSPPVAAGFTLAGNFPAEGRAARPQLFDAPFFGWWRIPLASVLEDAMGIPCAVRNDVVALVYSQHWFGAARGRSDFALLTVGAGIGYALCLRDQVIELAEEDIVEFGHHILDPGGPMCPVGHRGCISAYLSTGAILSAAAYGLHRSASLKEIARRSADGDAVCQDITRQAGWALGATVAAIANFTGVKTVLVAGESVDVARAGDPYIKEGLGQRRVHAREGIETPMLPSSFTEWARGGAVDAIRTFVVEER